MQYIHTGKSLEWRQSVEVMPIKLDDDVLEDMPPKSIHVSRDILTVVKTKTALLGSLSGVASPFPGQLLSTAMSVASATPTQIRDPYDAELFRDRTHHVVRACRSMAMASTVHQSWLQRVLCCVLPALL